MRTLAIDTSETGRGLGLEQLASRPPPGGLDDVVHDDAPTFCDSAGCSALLRFERESRLSGHPTHIRGETGVTRCVEAGPAPCNESMGLLADGYPPTFV